MKYLSNYFLLNINQRIKKMANKILWKLHQMCLFFFFFNNRINKQISERNMYKLKNDSNSISSTISITNELFNQNLRGWRKKKKNRIFIRKKKNISGDLKKFPIRSISDTMLNSNTDMFHVKREHLPRRMFPGGNIEKKKKTRINSCDRVLCFVSNKFRFE